MAGVNEYFQLVEQEQKAYLRIIPSVEDGEVLDVKEVMAYLTDIGYENFNMKELNDAVVQNAEEKQVYVGPWKGFHEQEKVKLTISRDFMLVYARFYAPSNQGQRMDGEEIKRDLASAGIQIGIQEEAIRQFLANREYCKDILIAKGIPPVQGKDAKIQYFFNTNMNRKPKRNEDGSVNYHELDAINHVDQGQCLAKLEKEVPGVSGKNVYGEEIQPRPVKSKKLSFSHNMELSEDGTELYSMVTGHVSLVKDKVFVTDVYEVPADVDTSTGNVVYHGNVHVKGNVKSGFRIDAKGNITVEGVVEGAELYAGGQIIVMRGIHGMNKGVLRAEGNIITKFIANATVSSNGYIETESILHSTVSARTDVKVGGKKGFITGGSVRAGNLVDARNIGSEMGAGTKIEVGVEPQTRERYYELQKEIAEINKEIDSIRPVLKNYMEKAAKSGKVSSERTKQVQTLAMNLKEKQQTLGKMQGEYQKLHESMAMANSAKVKVHGTLYAGVWIGISEMGMNVKTDYSHSKVVKEKGDILIRPL